MFIFVKNIHVNILLKNSTLQIFKTGGKYAHIHLRHGDSIMTAYAIACMRAP